MFLITLFVKLSDPSTRILNFRFQTSGKRISSPFERWEAFARHGLGSGTKSPKHFPTEIRNDGKKTLRFNFFNFLFTLFKKSQVGSTIILSFIFQTSGKRISRAFQPCIALCPLDKKIWSICPEHFPPRNLEKRGDFIFVIFLFTFFVQLSGRSP